MNHSITFEGDWALHGIMSDLGVNYALSPFHRIGFEIDDAGISHLAERYAERVFRARKWCDHEKLSWSTLLLRFEDGAFLVAHGDGRNCAEVIAPGSSQVAALHDEVKKALHGKAAPKANAFYMLRYDSCEVTADPIENLPEPVTDEFLQLCYGEDILSWIGSFAEKTLARNGGLTIFDGPPGTGKTSLITEMIRRLETTHVFYALPVSQDGALSSPELVPFWQKQNARHAEADQGDRDGRRRAPALAARGRQSRGRLVAAEHRRRIDGTHVAAARDLLGERPHGRSRPPPCSGPAA